MDDAYARMLADRFRGRQFSRWTAGDYVAHGGSAVVVRGEGTPLTALKVFDPALVKAHGSEIESARLQRELLLKGTDHPNLVPVLDGGEAEGTFFVAMEFVDGLVLADALDKFPRTQLHSAVGQLASAAKFLEDRGIVHRDIKPRNIMVSPDFSTLTLLDFGVIRPLFEKEITGSGEFLGTKRYAPPEFLYGVVGDTADAWRAVTFYQVGGVLHDLIMRKQMFSELVNEAMLMDAVKNLVPPITATDVDADLIVLATNCLTKKPQDRLRFVTWDALLNSARTGSDDIYAVRQRVISRRIGVTLLEGAPATEEQLRRKQQVAQAVVDSFVGSVRQACVESGDFPPIQIRIETGAPPAVVDACFAPSQTFAVPVSFGARFLIDVLDVATQAVQIQYEAYVGSPQSQIQLELYTGSYEASVVRRQVMAIMYSTLDAAQSAGTA